MGTPRQEFLSVFGVPHARTVIRCPGRNPRTQRRCDRIRPSLDNPQSLKHCTPDFGPKGKRCPRIRSLLLFRVCHTMSQSRHKCTDALISQADRMHILSTMSGKCLCRLQGRLRFRRFSPQFRRSIFARSERDCDLISLLWGRWRLVRQKFLASDYCAVLLPGAHTRGFQFCKIPTPSMFLALKRRRNLQAFLACEQGLLRLRFCGHRRRAKAFQFSSTAER
jgi:hypothetical protein